MNGRLRPADAALVTRVHAERDVLRVQFIKHLEDLGSWLDGGRWGRDGEVGESQEDRKRPYS